MDQDVVWTNSIMSDFQFSIITPTYNRADTLPRVYESLLEQTQRQFEWVIVDDGSTDDTQRLVNGWLIEAKLPIKSLVKLNGGKSDALNYGVESASGELVVILDSDDELKPNALEVFSTSWASIPEIERGSFIGVTGLCENQYGKLVGNRFPEDILDSNAIEVKYKHKLVGEKFGFLRLDVVKQYPFPVASDSTHIPEGVYWGRLAKIYRTRYINKIVRVYHQSPSSLSLSNIKNPIALAEGNRKWHEFILNEEFAWFFYCWHCFVRSALHYSRFSSHTGYGLYKQLTNLKNFPARALVLLSSPVGYLIYLVDLFRSQLNRKKNRNHAL